MGGVWGEAPRYTSRSDTSRLRRRGAAANLACRFHPAPNVFPTPRTPLVVVDGHSLSAALPRGPSGRQPGTGSSRSHPPATSDSGARTRQATSLAGQASVYVRAGGTPTGLRFLLTIRGVRRSGPRS
jgi:hypothetical protein